MHVGKTMASDRQSIDGAPAGLSQGAPCGEPIDISPRARSSVQDVGGATSNAEGHSPFRRLGAIGDSVMISHTLFSLPFVISAILLETDGHPPFWKLFWIVVAAFGARNAANALNRIIDKDIDSKNPRTAGRHLPSGRLKPRDLWLFTAAMLALLVLGAAMLNPLCVMLLPVAGVLLFGYSYTKRFTWLSHYWLGIACSAATMGAFLGISGTFQLRYFPLTAGVALWVAGFDILYALQDIEFDRKEHLYSIPARFGETGGRIFAALNHVGALLGFASIYYFWEAPGLFTAIALALCFVLLVAEQLIAVQKTEHRIKLAAYTLNQILPMIYLFGVALDIYVR